MKRVILMVALAAAAGTSSTTAAQDRIVTWSEIVEQTLGPKYDVLEDPIPDDVEKLQVLVGELRNRLLRAEGLDTVAAAETNKAAHVTKARAAYFTPQNYNAVYEMKFTSRGKILWFLSSYNETFKSGDECWNHIERETIAKWRTSTYRQKYAWLMNDHVLIEFVTDRFGRSFWRATIEACGPKKESVHQEKNISNMGLNFDALVRAVTDSIHEHGFEP